jgi:hypothetical protein
MQRLRIEDRGLRIGMKDCRFKISNVRRLVAGVLLALGLSVSLWAQPQTPVPTPTVAMEGFEKLSETAPREELPATPLVFYAYAFVWLALIVYVFSIWRRMGRVEQDLAAVQRRLREGPGGR